MIIYNLACGQGHAFEGWFSSSDDCARQIETGLLTCPTCNSAEVRKMPTASHVHTPANTGNRQPAAVGAAEMVAKLREYLRSHTVDVGDKFAEQARQIHYGEREPAPIRGQARPDEVRELAEEGIDVVALPSFLTETPH